MENLYSYGEDVTVEKTAPIQFRPGEFAKITEVTFISNNMFSQLFNAEIGTWAYTIEYLDKTLMKVPEKFISKNNKFTWGDRVIVSPEASEKYRSSEYADVVGMTLINTEERALKYSLDIGTWVYLIEYSDGSDAEVPEKYLAKENVLS